MTWFRRLLARLSSGANDGTERVALVVLALMNAYLISPLVLNEIRSLLLAEQIDKLLLFSIPASLLWLLVLHAWVERPFVLHLALLPAYFTVGVDLWIGAQYDIRLSSSSLSVMLDNQENAGDYFASNVAVIVVPTLALGIAYTFSVLRLRGLRLPWARRLRLPATIGLLVVYALVSMRQIRTHKGVKPGLIDVASHDLSSPFGVLPQLGIAYMVYRDTIEHEREAKDFRFDARRDGPADQRLIVLVIGESSRPDHWSLYGYGRPTTPQLQARSDVLAFRDVTAEAALTKLSVPLIITRGDADTMKRYNREKSIVTAYRDAGYRTAWLSTQQRDQWTGAINRYTNEADYQRFLERRLDLVLISELTHWLEAPEQAGKPAFVVLHTQGSHFTYQDRYPPTFDRFGAGTGTERERMMGSYDNSILYTDEVLASVIRKLEGLPRPTAMLYVADHAENLRDDARNLFGHFFGNDKDIPIPMVLWLSPRFVALEPERSAAAGTHLDKPINTSAVFHTLLDIGRCTIPGDDEASTRSLMRTTFTPRKRLIFTKTQAVVDFDERYPGVTRKKHAGDPVSQGALGNPPHAR